MMDEDNKLLDSTELQELKKDSGAQSETFQEAPKSDSDSSSSNDSMRAIKDISLDQMDKNRGDVDNSEVEDGTNLEENANSNDDVISEHTKKVEEYMLAAKKGDIPVLKQLLESGDVKVNDCLSENVSALHWCALNNHLAAIKYLVSKGADINFAGGNLVATPLQWACRYGYVYLVDYLLRTCKAEYKSKDIQGFNCLHLAVHSSNIMMVIYITRFTDIDIDETDPKGRTALHWAAYQGDVLSVEYLLQLHPSVNISDELGFIPLQWCLVRQSQSTMTKLIAAGSDLHHLTANGKDCWTMAREMNSTSYFTAALRECGYSKDYTRLYKYTSLFSKRNAKILTFFSPFLVLTLCLQIIANSGNALIGLVIATIIYIGQTLLIGKKLVPFYNHTPHALLKSPFFSGVFASTAFLCIVSWVFKLLPATFLANPLSNIVLFILILILVPSFIKSMTSDPGCIPREKDNMKIKQTIEQLIYERKFDASNFCIYTMIRKPLRSRFDRDRMRNIARFDHYCPWVSNQVGVRNHKTFLCFATSLHLAIFVIFFLTRTYFNTLDEEEEEEDENTGLCSLIGENFCLGYRHSSYTFYLLIWVVIQQTWLTMLILVQFLQISRGYTTYEFDGRHAHLHNSNPTFASIPTDELAKYGQAMRVESSDTADSTIETLNDMPANQEPQKISSTSKVLFCLSAGVMKSSVGKILGLKQFALISRDLIRMRGRRQFQQIGSPYNYGFVKNWLNFLFLKKPGESYSLKTLVKIPEHGEANLGDSYVDYYRLYQAPANPNYTLV